MSDRIRVAIVVSHPIQHFVHLYRALAKVPTIDLLVIFAADIGVRKYFDKDMNVEIAWETDLLSGYNSVFLPESSSIQRTGFWTLNNPSIAAALGTFRPDVVQLHGYGHVTVFRALLWSKLYGVPLLLWSDSSLLFQRSLFKRVAKKIVITLLMSLFNGVLTTGSNNAAYYLNYGVPRRKLFRCPFTVDETHFAMARASIGTKRIKMRRTYGVPENAFLVLFVGKLMPLKRPQDVLHALLKTTSRSSEWSNLTVFFAGDGRLKADLEEYSVNNNLQAIFGGFINVNILPYIYAMADLLVFPSDREAYGLSAREAICLGLPLIVSDQIGCIGADDAARPQENAIVYPAGDVDALSEAIELLAIDAGLLRSMGAASLRIAEELNVDSSVNGFLDAVRTVV
ncbi:MAG: glycosyltransferase family 4 protein [Geobacteraceae bacterium]|nr:glycosyltransferase family 4 protein [Geobacteraceae bacterium]